jgi:hypothetical protein
MFLASPSKGYTLKGDPKRSIETLSEKEFKTTLTPYWEKTAI